MGSINIINYKCHTLLGIRHQNVFLFYKPFLELVVGQRRVLIFFLSTYTMFSRMLRQLILSSSIILMITPKRLLPLATNKIIKEYAGIFTLHGTSNALPAEHRTPFLSEVLHKDETLLLYVGEL